MIKGIDVSDNNGRIDWAAVKAAGVQFAILRLGYGDDITSQDDVRFEENVAGCEQNGIPWGAYIYSYAMSVEEAKSEAAHCLRRLKNKRPTYPVCFDMEDADGYKQKRGGLSKETAVNICETFLDTMEDNGWYACLYASLSWLNGILNDRRLDRFDKWVAQWNTVCEYHGEYGLWQYGGSTNYVESPYLPGVNGAVDKDYAYKDYPSLIKENGLNNNSVEPIGWLDGAGITQANGWAYNGVNDTPIAVHIYAFKNGEPIFLCAAQANEYREDLAQNGIGNGYHAYTAEFDLTLLGAGEYLIKAYAIGDKNQPQLKGEKTVAVSESDLPQPPATEEPPQESAPPQENGGETPTPDSGVTGGEDEGTGILAALKKLLRLILKWIAG